MRRLVATVFLSYGLSLSSASNAGFACSGILLEHQVEGLKKMFTPAYGPGLTHIGGRVEPANFSKKLDATRKRALAKATPTVAASKELSETHAQLLKGWLNDRASTTIPGWFTTTLGIAAPTAWIGLAADAFVQLINASGDTGRLKVANLAGNVSAGGYVGVLEQVSKSASGEKFIWAYLYQYVLNGKNIASPLFICTSDLIPEN